MRREKPAPAPFDPLDEALAIRVPGDNKLRPTTLGWSSGEEEVECDCMWNWGDGPDRAPKGLFAGALEDLFRLFEALAWSRGAESVFVIRQPYWKYETDVDLRSLCQTPEVVICTHRADPVMEHANARIGSPVAQGGQIVYRLRNLADSAMLPENEAERQRIASLPRRTPIPTVLSDEPPLGFISEFPVVF